MLPQTARLGRALLALPLLASVDCARPERRLVIAHPRGLASQAVYHPSHGRSEFGILSNVYEPLVERGPGLALRPVLAESWYSPDEHTWVFKLRSGLRRHDGRTLRAQDVVRSLERAQADNWAAGVLAPVSGIAARGELEVVITTREPCDTLPARLVYPYVTGDPEPGGATGPYRMRSWAPGASVVLEAFPGYRDGAPPIGVVEFQVVPDAHERARRLMAGQVQLADEVVAEDMPVLSAAAGIRTAVLPGLVTAFLAMDTARERSPYVDSPTNPFRDPRVRASVDLAVDRPALVAGALRGYADAIGQLAAPGQIGFEPAFSAANADPGEARRLLQEAGFAGGFEVQLDYLRGAVEVPVRALADQLQAVGIRVRPRAGEPSEFFTRVERRDTSLYLLRWVQPSVEIHETYTWLLHSPIGSLGSMNGGGYSDRRLDGLLERFAHESSERERGRLLREATALVRAARPIVPLYRQHDLYAWSDRLDFQPQPDEQFGTILRRMRWKR